MKQGFSFFLGAIMLTAAISTLVFSSCSTMAKYDELRKQRIAEKAKQEPSPSATPDNGTAGNGTLFSPLVQRDLAAEERKKASDSLAEAQQIAKDADPTKLTDVAKGPIVPSLRATLTAVEDITTVAKAYQAYSEAVVAVSISLKAYGLVKNLTAIEQVRRAAAWWTNYFATMQIQTTSTFPSKDVLEKFFNSIGANDERVNKAISDMNTFVDGQRTRAYVP